MESEIYLRSIAKSFDDKVDQLIDELNAYSNERVIWEVSPHISNSAGTLVVHLLGNLNHFIGASLGNTGYVRNRPEEFSLDFKPRTEMIAALKECREMIREVLSSFEPDDLTSDYPTEFRGTINPEEKSLIHIFGHLAYHAGQINYHRRILDV